MVISIVTLISSTTLFNHSKFNSSVTLENLAYEVALTIRQAQFFGMYVREVNLGTANFDTGYGVYFNKGTDPTSFIFFADLDDDNIYDATGELLDKFNMVSGNNISSICVDNGSGCTSVNEVYISFKRPNPDAIIKTNNYSNCTTGCSLVKIYIGTPRENVSDKIVTVSSVGQISITTAP
jgi:hypothetical protein